MDWRTWTLAMLAMLAMGRIAEATDLGALQSASMASMVVDAEVTIDKTGHVEAYEIDHPEQLPVAVAEVLAKAVPRWRFAPHMREGVPVHAKASAGILMVARRVGADQFAVSVEGANFQIVSASTSKAREGRVFEPPSYPADMVRAGASGIVYLVVKFGRDGKAVDAFVEKVNLYNTAKPKRMAYMRARFADAAIEAARRWSYPSAMAADAPFWLVRVPVEFRFEASVPYRYGEWQVYAPGPRRANPWAADDDVVPETLAIGGAHAIGRAGLRLVSPLQSGL